MFSPPIATSHPWWLLARSMTQCRYRSIPCTHITIVHLIMSYGFISLCIMLSRWTTSIAVSTAYRSTFANFRARIDVTPLSIPRRKFHATSTLVRVRKAAQCDKMVWNARLGESLGTPNTSLFSLDFLVTNWFDFDLMLIFSFFAHKRGFQWIKNSSSSSCE